MCISTLKKNPAKIFVFSGPANFLHQPANSLKKNPKNFFGFSDPANFLHQPPSSLKKNSNFFFGFSDPANFLHQPPAGILGFFRGKPIFQIFFLSSQTETPYAQNN
jgi:hypothetical protein